MFDVGETLLDDSREWGRSAMDGQADELVVLRSTKGIRAR
ncbi:hypothetical protein EV192_104103 [Actinocrispum wychmicini]|uniref:Uncharacterized protein n=1 Tax=Actinocrispum wychmicini TaxID=1213861 RepID=A0A4R2JL22_9PSEU|nr:hypothetical protein EV192_104103 [Actinocrispum wychmicini]